MFVLGDYILGICTINGPREASDGCGGRWYMGVGVTMSKGTVLLSVSGV